MTLGAEKPKGESKTKAPKKDGVKDLYPSGKFKDPETNKVEEFYSFNSDKYILIPRPNQID